jgi:hypothetical protein
MTSCAQENIGIDYCKFYKPKLPSRNDTEETADWMEEMNKKYEATSGVR